MTIDGRPYAIVGVLPAGFELGGRADRQPDAFVPIRMAEERVGWVGDHNNAAIGRLKPGVSVEAAQAELDVLQTQISAVATADAHEPVTLASAVIPLTETIVGRARRGLLLLLAAIAAVLLIACANLANLAMTRAVVRQRDAAIRAALGASRARLCVRALVEQLGLSLAGGVLGWWIASASIALFVRTAPIDLPRASEIHLDATVLAFAAAVTVLCGILVAIGPAWRVAQGAAQPSLRQSSAGVTSDRSALVTRSALLALQVALSVMLLVVTALLSMSFLRLMNVDRGFDARRVLAVAISMPATRYATQPQTVALYDRMIAAVRTLPAVEIASTTSMLPLRGQGQVNFVAAEGDRRPRADHPTANFRFVSPDFFRTLGITILRGRSFTDAERDANVPLPAVVSVTTAARLWPNGDALGQRFSRGEEREQGFIVVGIVSTERTTSLESEPPLMVYIPYWWWQRRTTTTLLVKTAIEPAALTATVRRAIAGIDPDIAIGDAQALESIVDASVASRRYQARLFVVFGMAALAIASVGVYGVTAYGVSRRRREMNIRLALGARTSQVMRLVVGQGLMPILVGIAAGCVGALAAGGVVASLLFDVRARDPLIVTAVAAIVAAAGALACAGAARQGLVLNPAAALREE
jgi:putative ABC transport system permease protein